MTSTLILYKSCKIREEKLFIVDDITSYLSTLTKETITGFQYQRQGMSLKVKINKSQDVLNFIATNDFNYASIQNDSQKICYYFIKSKKQLADSTIELELSMDTINTFRPTTDFEISAKTKINREHKDRVIKSINKAYIVLGWNDDYDSGGTVSLNQEVEIRDGSVGGTLIFTGKLYEKGPKYCSIEVDLSVYDQDSINDYFDNLNYQDPAYIVNEYGNYFAIADIVYDWEISYKYNRKIDINSEGLTPLLYGKNKGVLQDDDQSWYLIYKGNNPLNCYLCADHTFNATIQKDDKEIVPSDLTAGTYYYILPERNANGNAAEVYMHTDEGYSINARITSNPDSYIKRTQTVAFYYKDGADIKVGMYYYNDIGLGFFYVSTIGPYTTSKIIIDGSTSFPIKGNTLGSLSHDIASIRSGASFNISLTTETYTVYDITTINRTDSDIAKVIKLPYRPCDDNYSGWGYDAAQHMLILKNLDTPLEKSIITNYNPFEPLEFTGDEPSLNADKDAKWESKLFHSDYYQPKFIYDSFSFIFALERQKNYVSLLEFSIIFTATGTINSRFLFTFASYNVDGYALEDYSNILPIARNNELPIYNSDYINYIKMGFNYDVKTKQRQEAGQWIGTALSLVGSIASFASSSVTGGFGIAGGISLATATLGQLVNAVNSTAQAEANQAQKLYQLRQQKESVMGSDDIDLMSKYTGNKAKWMLYEVSERMKSVLYDLFFYTGYLDGTSKIPNVSTRKWFNFLSCDLVINEDNNLNDDIINDIKAKYGIGVTFMHCNTINAVKTWDWAQEKENWEVTLFN